MDPLSLIASCVSIVDGIRELYKFARENIHSSTTVRNQLSALIARCCACRGIIEGIKLQAELDKDNQSRLHLLDHVAESLDTLKRAIQLMTDKAKKLPQHIVFGKTLSHSINDCLKTFDDTLRILQLALQADQFTVLNATHTYVKEIKNDVANLDSTLERLIDDISELKSLASEEAISQKAHQEAASRHELRLWLSSFDVAQLYRSLAEKQYPGTCSWFVEEFLEQWLQQDEKPHRVLWLQGRSGTGKTTLVTSAIEHVLIQRQRSAIAYFFCSSSLDDTRSSGNLLSSILVQLCDQKPELWHGIRAWWGRISEQHQGLIRSPSAEEVSDMLRRVCGNFSDIILIIDAPNESENPRKLLATIGTFVANMPNLKLFLSSTPDLDIDALQFSDYTIVSMSSVQINADISKCIRARMEEEEQLQDLPLSVQDLIHTKLVERADGSFRWAQCQLSAIAENATSEAAVVRSLENLAGSLEELYTRTLTNFPVSQRKLVRTALLWLVFAVRPLHIDEIREAMILRVGTEIDLSERLLPGKAESLLGKCRMLVDYDASGKNVNIAHSSVRDFLISESCRSGTAGYFHLDYHLALCHLTWLTVGYLSMKSLAGGYVASSADYTQRLNECPLLFYAADSWPIFSQRIDWQNPFYRSQTERIMQNFFDTSETYRGGNFSSWIQTYEPRHLRIRLNVNDNQPLSAPLYYAARSGLREVAEMILRVYGKAGLDTPGGSRASTPLHVAAAYGHSTMVKFLLEQGADPDERNKYDERGMAWADRYGYEDIVQMYLDFGARPLTIEDRQALPGRHRRPMLGVI